MSLTGQPNAMGGREMGYMGPGLPGQRSVLSAHDSNLRRAAVGGCGGGPFVPTSDRAPIEMFEQTRRRRKSRHAEIICTNPVATVANRKTVITGLENAQLVITQDTYRTTATNPYADIVLPATLWGRIRCCDWSIRSAT